MMTSFGRLGRAFFLLLTLAGGVTAARATRDRSPGSVPTTAPVIAPAEPVERAWEPVSLEGRDPFREDRTPSSLRYLSFDPDDEGSIGQAHEPPLQRPEWTLSGVLWGREPLALFDGIPTGQSSGILAEGDTVGLVVVDRISPDTVFLRSRGASWAFTMQTPRNSGGKP